MNEYRSKGCQSQMVKKKIVSDKGNCITPIKRLATFGECSLSNRFFLFTLSTHWSERKEKHKEKEGMTALSLRGGPIVLQKNNLACEDLIIVKAVEKCLTLLCYTKFVIY